MPGDAPLYECLYERLYECLYDRLYERLYVSDLLGLDWTGFGLKSSPLRFCREDPTELEDSSRRNTHYFKEERLKALLHLLRRPYWQRMWIIQELAMGHYCITVICGKRRIFWG